MNYSVHNTTCSQPSPAIPCASFSTDTIQKFGYDYVYSALDLIPPTGASGFGRFSAQYAWNAINAFLAVSGKMPPLP